MTKEFLIIKCPNERLRERFPGIEGERYPPARFEQNVWSLVLGASLVISH